MKRDPDSPPVTPKQARSVRTRERIFAAAARVFSDKGLEGARVDEIARLARVNKQRIYAYFGSKKELYREVLIEIYAQVARNRRLLELSDRDIPRMTEVIVDTFFEIHERNPMFWRMLSWENLSGGRSLQPADWRRLRSTYIRHIQVLYERGRKQGYFRADVDFVTYLMLLFSTTYFYFSNQLTMSHLMNLRLRSEVVRQRVEKQLLTVMAHGVETG